VIRHPSWSVSRSCAPGCGRSRRAMIRIPAGQPVWVAGRWRVSSATCAVACLAVGVDRLPPAPPGQGGDRLAGVDAHRVLQAQRAQVVQQRPYPGGGVPTHQHPAADLLG
jgi:hypothetical protein